MGSVATVLTVYGIETVLSLAVNLDTNLMLQQYLPFTVLKQHVITCLYTYWGNVATVLTVYGIETYNLILSEVSYYVATVLTVYGIETEV